MSKLVDSLGMPLRREEITTCSHNPREPHVSIETLRQEVASLPFTQPRTCLISQEAYDKCAQLLARAAASTGNYGVGGALALYEWVCGLRLQVEPSLPVPYWIVPPELEPGVPRFRTFEYSMSRPARPKHYPPRRGRTLQPRVAWPPHD